MLEHRKTRTVEHSRTSGPVDRYVSKAAAHRAAGRFDKARRNIRLALDAAPDYAAAHYELGVLTCKTEAAGSAVPHFIAALRGAPEQPTYWFALATTLFEAGRLDDARAIMQRFTAQGPSGDVSRLMTKAFVQNVFSAARARFDANDLAAAEPLLDLVIALDDTHADATYLAGAVAARTSRLQQAFDLFSIAIYRNPDNAVYFSSLGAVLIAMGNYTGAVSALEKAIALNPDLASAHSNLAGVLHYYNRHGDALSHARRAISQDPGNAGAYVNLAASLKCVGQLQDALEAYDKAVALDPTDAYVHSNRLFAKLYCEGVPPTGYAADAHAFGTRFADPLLRRRVFGNDRDPNRRLRVGFVSGDLCKHAVARFLEPFLRHLDKARFEAHAYMTRTIEDEVSRRLRTLFESWTSIAALGDDEAADRIEADAIDILVDLSGHTAGNRLLVFARKPAPVQVTWIGLPATTGMKAMDYRLTDCLHDLPGTSDALYAETLWRLPRVSATYLPSETIPEVRSRPPFEDNGYVTFGVFNRFDKISDRTLQVWSGILDAMPDARLFMVVADIDAPDIRAQVERRLSGAGIPLDRVRLHPHVATGHFKLYHNVDIALDPFPYNGGTTSCDTLCMGVPFITLRGDRTIARTGVAVLTAVGLESLVAETLEDYVDRAVALARDPARLRGIRSGLRARVSASPLMDHAGLAADVGEAFRAMWRRWVDASPSA